MAANPKYARGLGYAIPNDRLSEVFFSKKNMQHINASVKQNVYDLIGWRTGDLNVLELHEHLMSIYTNMLPWIYRPQAINKTLLYRVEELRDLFIVDITQNVLTTVREIFNGIELKRRIPNRPYDINSSITTATNHGIQIPVGDDYLGGMTSNMSTKNDRRRPKLVYSATPEMGRSYMSKL